MKINRKRHQRKSGRQGLAAEGLGITFLHQKSEGEAGLKISFTPLFPALQQIATAQSALRPCFPHISLGSGALPRGWGLQHRLWQWGRARGTRWDTGPADVESIFSSWLLLVSVWAAHASTKGTGSSSPAFPTSSPELALLSCPRVFGEPGQAPSAFPPPESQLQPPGRNPFRRYPRSSCREPSQRNLH